MINIEAEFQKNLPLLAEAFSSDGLKECQKKAVSNVMDKGNTLCVMPTGGGKSLVYWLSGLILGGITIVVSPLISLIDEQQEKLTAQGIEVLTLHGHMDISKQTKLLKDFANRIINPRFIFASPEKLATDGFFEYCVKVRKDDIKLITIDEVHCVSQWGMSFRPFYGRIYNFIETVFADKPPKLLALTATLNPKELGDICAEFRIEKSDIIKDDLLMRSEITLKVLKFNVEDEKEEKLWDLLKIHKGEKTLVYVYRKYKNRSVEGLSELANERGFHAMYFHGDMTAHKRNEIVKSYKNNDIDIIFATNAFGMGIDIPDIRVVIHYMIPESVEQYYQEIGRAARDKNASNAYLLYSNKNIDIKRQYFIDASFPTQDKLITVYKKIAGYGLGLQALPYFEDEEIQQCLLYFVNCGLIKIHCKGFSSLKPLANIQNIKLSEIAASSKVKTLISSAKKSGVPLQEIVSLTYESIINGEAVVSPPLDRRLIIEVTEPELPEAKIDEIMADIEQKRKYKHELLDYFIFTIDNNASSTELHQEIARYLGVDKHKLGRIYSTSKGDMVRSKSEVIIANLLHEHKIDYEYEMELKYCGEKYIEPDFTIKLPNNKQLYWEHLGMLGTEEYDERWLYKIDVYEKFFPSQLVKTYEGATITNSALKEIEKLRL